MQISENVVKNTTKRNFTVSGLLPRTEYAFSVSAINNISNGSCGSVTVNTSVPLRKLIIVKLIITLYVEE